MTHAWGRGIATIASDGSTLDTWYRHLGFGQAPNPGIADDPAAMFRKDAIRDVETVGVDIAIDTEAAPTTASDVYLRLHLLSHRLMKPRTINLDGAFGLLTNVAWTNLGPCAIATIDDVRVRVRSAGQFLTVHGIDKFPRMTDYVMPSGVRIADADRVRLGAHLAEGTTVMHEGTCRRCAPRMPPRRSGPASERRRAWRPQPGRGSSRRRSSADRTGRRG